MASRIAKLPIIACACLVAGVVIGLVLAPASAQQMSPVDGQVAVRSDYAVYLIANGQRRWIATVLITDDEINAYPEAEPIFSGVQPLPAQVAAAPPQQVAPQAAQPSPAAAAPPAAAQPVQAVPGAAAPAAGAAAPAPVPGAAAAPAAAAPAGSVASAPASGPPPGGYPTPVGAVGEIDPLLPLEVDIDGKAIFEHGNEINVVVKSQVGATCELTVRWPDASEAPQQPMAADARGRCSFKVRVPSTVPNGLGLMKGSVRQGGRVSNQTVEFEIVTDVT
jgi:hypothetical protein